APASTCAASPSPSASTSASAPGTAADSLPRTAGDRPGPPPCPHANPQRALLDRPHPPCEIESSRPRDPPEPAAGGDQACRLPSDPGRRPALISPLFSCGQRCKNRC